MKRIVFLVIFIIISTCLQAQSVLGIPFGSTYEHVKDKLESRFGKSRVYEEGGKLLVLKPIVGNIEFRFGEFYFQRSEYSSYLNEVFLQEHFENNDTNPAKYMRESVADILRQKYEVVEYISKEGFKCYEFGTNPKDENKYLGELSIFRSKGNDGKQRLYLTLTYGPIYYIDRTSDF